MADTMTTATNGVVITDPGVQVVQFQDLFNVIAFTFSFEEDSIENATTSTKDITVTGAKLGDFVLIGPSIDLVEINMFGTVRADDSVTIWATNLQEVDAATTLATIATHNGLILQPRRSWAAVGT